MRLRLTHPCEFPKFGWRQIAHALKLVPGLDDSVLVLFRIILALATPQQPEDQAFYDGLP
jgi:hypothetical protein